MRSCLCRQANHYGSIGVFGILPNFQTWQTASESDGTPSDGSWTMTVSRPKTEAELEVLQGYVERIYDASFNLWLRVDQRNFGY